MPGSRNWVFTINNPLDNEYPEKWPTEHLKLIVYQSELGHGSGILHLQGYLELVSPRNLDWLKKHLNKHAHWEPRKGTRTQALEYCTKEDTRLGFPQGWTKEFPDAWHTCANEDLDSFWKCLNLCLTKTGTESRTSETKLRLSQIQSQLKDGSTSIKDIADNEFDLWVRYFRAFERYITMNTPPRNHEVDVHVIVGPTGTGKSKWALENYPSAYWKQRSKWWDGYFKHKEVKFIIYNLS